MGKGVAVDMDTGEYMDTSGGEFNAAVKRSLRYNDYIIKKNYYRCFWKNIVNQA